MPYVVFAPAIQRHVASPPRRISASTIRAALHAVFDMQSALRDYVVDEQDQLRKHVTIFIDNKQIADRHNLDQLVADDAKIYVVQALSGG